MTDWVDGRRELGNGPMIVPGDNERATLLTELLAAGVLHQINEQVLWPLGVELVVELPHFEQDGARFDLWPFAALQIVRTESPTTSLTEEEHAARHSAFEAYQRLIGGARP